MKKIISAILSIIMVVTISSQVFAEEKSSMIAECIRITKQKLDLPSWISEAEFNSSYSTKEGEETTIYLRWSKDDMSINVMLDDDYNINNYSIQNNDNEGYNYLKLPKQEALHFANEQLKKIIPEMFDNEKDMLIYRDENNSKYSGYYFKFDRYKDNVPVLGDGVSITIGLKDNLPYIKNFNSHISNYEFQDNDIMDKDSAISQYKEQFPLKLQYRYINFNKDGCDLKLEYQPQTHYINAQTGVEEFKYVENGYLDKEDSESMQDAISGGNINFSEAEKENIEELSNLVPLNEINEKLLKTQMVNVSDDFVKGNTYYRKSEYLNDYIISANYNSENAKSNYNISYEGSSGELLSYYYWNSDINEKKDIINYSLDELNNKANIAMEFIKKVAPSKAEQIELKNVVQNKYNGEIDVSFNRMIDGIPLVNDSVNVILSNDGKYVLNFNILWTGVKLNIPSKEKAISSEKAYDILINKYPMNLMYLLTNELADNEEKIVFKKVYGITLQGMYIDALDGKFINYLGEEEIELPKEYTDIQGHWAEDKINILLDMSIGLPSKQLRPDESITMRDYLYLLSLINNGIVAYPKIYGIETEVPINENELNKPVDRTQAVKMLMDIIGYGDVAKIQGIYKTGFLDENEINPEYIGYIALAKGLGYISGNKGYFNGNALLTKAEAMSILYNYFTL